MVPMKSFLRLAYLIIERLLLDQSRCIGSPLGEAGAYMSVTKCTCKFAFLIEILRTYRGSRVFLRIPAFEYRAECIVLFWPEEGSEASLGASRLVS